MAGPSRQRPAATRRMGAILAALALASCAGEPPYATSSSTLARSSDGTIWLASPDDDALVGIDPDTLSERARIAIEGGPEGVAAVGQALVVTLGRAAEVAWVEGDAVTRLAVPCGGTRAVVADGRGGALVSCPWDDLVLGLGPEGVRFTLAAPGRPTALAVLGDRFAVSASRTGRLREHALDDLRVLSDVALADRRGHAATLVDAIGADPERGGFVALYQLVDHDSDRARPPSRGGYGSVDDGEPRIEPRLSGPCGGRYARFDGGARVFSGPSAIAIRGGVRWVVHRGTDDVAALGCDEGAALAPRLATFHVGRGPRGVLASEDGRVAWVDVGFAHAVARLELDRAARGPEGPAGEASLERTRARGASALSEAARRGRALFFDATNTHLTPSGIVSCGSCHPDGGEDGLAWFLHTANVGPKLRRTPAAWGARAALSPFHWDGEFADAAELTRATIRELMEGDGLFVDTAAIAAWMAEAPTPPGRPVRDAEDRARVARGEALFAERGCGECHAGPHLSDARRHEVLAPSEDEAARLPGAITPSLRAVRARPPYFHDGRAPTLRALVAEHHGGGRHGRTADLDGADLDALVAYLETL
ncbi:MAG: c-type cytochrome [Sandaracinaceae bacterium]|nr:c-type cytochrome [Sandaracinaceae bacterium]